MALALSCLPVLATESKPARMVNFASETAVAERKTCPVEKLLTADQRAVMMERVEFCRQVYQIIKSGKTQNEAVNLVSTRACDFPNLVKGGHEGTSALSISIIARGSGSSGKRTVVSTGRIQPRSRTDTGATFAAPPDPRNSGKHSTDFI